MYQIKGDVKKRPKKEIISTFVFRYQNTDQRTPNRYDPGSSLYP